MRRSVEEDGAPVLEERCLACGAEEGGLMCGMCARLSVAEARVDPELAASLRWRP